MYNINVSKVFEKDYLFALIYFDVHIEGISLIENDRINQIYSRVAEVKLIRKDTYWEPYIVDVRFPQPKDLNQNYQAVTISTEEAAPIETTETKVDDLEKKFDQILSLLMEEKEKNKQTSETETQQPSPQQIDQTANKTEVNLNENPQDSATTVNTSSTENERVGEQTSPHATPVKTTSVNKAEESTKQARTNKQKIPQKENEKQGDSLLTFEEETPNEKNGASQAKTKEDIKILEPNKAYLPKKKKFGGPIFLIIVGMGSLGTSYYFDGKSNNLYDTYNTYLNVDDLVYADKSREEHYEEANDYHHYAYLTKYGGYAALGLGGTWLILKLLKKNKPVTAFDSNANQYYLSLTPNQFTATAKIKF